ncbi:MAG TPA: ester cyclase [Thermoleophilaceae bacterium]|nr:ester cyclase [Thermoleophilaceae bacterium]
MGRTPRGAIIEHATVDNAAKTRRDYQELWNDRNFNVIDDWIAPDFVGHYTSQPEPVRGVDGFRRFVDETLAAFPDLKATILDQVVEGDKVVSRVELRGTHAGPLLGFAPTNQVVSVTYVGIEQYRDGLCVEEWVYSDDLCLSRQIKAIPEPGSRAERIGWALQRLSTRRMRK